MPPIVGSRSKPAGERPPRNVALDVGNPVLEMIGETKNDRIAEADVGDFVEDPLGFAVSDLKDPAPIDLGAQINAHRNHAVVAHIVVPRIVVNTTGDHTVHPTIKTPEVGSASDGLSDLEELLVLSRMMWKMRKRSSGVLLGSEGSTA
jgi:hypothetical protein